MRFSSSKASTLAVALASSAFLAKEVVAFTVNSANVATLPVCSTVNSAPQYDYIVGKLLNNMPILS